MTRTTAKKATCPSCGQSNGVQIFWGIPGVAAFAAEQRGEVVLGGTDMPPFFEMPPNTHCLSCGARWNDPDRFVNNESTPEK